MMSIVVACKRSTIEKRPEVCEAFVQGLMEGLRHVYVNPEESLKIHLDSVKDFQNANLTNRKVIEFGQAISTSLGMVPEFKENGLGYMDPGLVAQTAKTVTDYMGVRNLPAVDSMFTNKFVGSTKLTDQEWSEVEPRSAQYRPSAKNAGK
jgi:NitT/TauT family transport system substrate-binding protein